MKLNDSAADILRRCDGATPLKTVTADLEAAYGESDLGADVAELIDAALQQGWLSRS